jgi:queuine tRNA-ribosyltransferase
MTAPVRVDVHGRDGTARTGVAHTARGSYRVPCFMPVGTRGAVKYLDANDYDALGAEIVLANTYHLMLRPGAHVVEALGGVGAFAGWRGLTLTDSGGFQVFSLEPRIDDDGVTFRSTYDGTLVRFTPQEAVRVQELLGADIQMVLDVCPGLPAPDDVVRMAVDRTASWAARAKAVHVRPGQALFGIVQGGIDEKLRTESARRTVELDFDGYGIGGLSVGETRDQMVPALAAALAELPEHRPRYLMGVGDPASLVEAVALGVDQFDCVLQTRLGRHGTALTGSGKVHLKNAVHARSDDPIDHLCACSVCARYSRGYLRHLFQVGEATGKRLVSLHNLAWTFALMDRMRSAIAQGRFSALRDEVLATWG